MLSKNRNHTKRVGSTRLAAIRVTNIDDSLEVTNSFAFDICLILVVWKLYPRWRNPNYINAFKIILCSIYLCV